MLIENIISHILDPFLLDVATTVFVVNPHNCISYVETRWILGFIVSKYGIQVDSLKVKDI